MGNCIDKSLWWLVSIKKVNSAHWFFPRYLNLKYFICNHHCQKYARFRSFSGPYFPAFGLMTERYSVLRKNTNQKNSEYGHFSRSARGTYRITFIHTAWKMSKYGVFSGPYSVSCIRRGKYGPGKTPYLDTFHAVTELADRRCCVKKVFMKI